MWPMIRSSSVPAPIQAEADLAWRIWFVVPYLKDPEKDPQVECMGRGHACGIMAESRSRLTFV
jgi:hypothetical protein